MHEYFTVTAVACPGGLQNGFSDFLNFTTWNGDLELEH
jgi:hypothetical protein